jgi:hypothetical protein
MTIRRIAIVIVALAALVRVCAAQEPAWLARVGTASGAVITPDGFIISAEHVTKGEGRTTKVVVAGREYVGRVSDQPVNGIDECVVVKIDAKDLKFIHVARTSPKPGDAVTAYGYPHGNYAKTTGTITRIGNIQGQYRLPGGYESNVFVQPGSSGGPLVDTKGQLVGLCHGVELSAPIGGKMVNSKWIGLQPILTTLKWSAKPKGKAQNAATVYAFVHPGCAPCAAFQNDFPAGEHGGITIRYVDRSDTALLARIRAATGQPLPNVDPCFWVEGTNRVEVGYAGRSGFLQFLHGIASIPLAAFLVLESFFIGSPDPGPPPIESMPVPEPTPVGEQPPEIGEPGQPEGAAEAPKVMPIPGGMYPPTPEEITEATDVDFTDVTLVALVSEWDSMPAPLARMILDNAVGPLQAAVKSRSEGKANLYIVSQRTHPVRFQAVQGAAAVTVEKVRVLCIVGQQNLGIKGIIAPLVERKIQDMVDDKLGNLRVPVDIVFERIQGDVVAGVKAALSIQEPDVMVADGETPEEETPWYYGLVGALISPAKAAWLAWLNKKKTEQAA